MKIAMVVPCFLPLPEGGAERQCRLQARELVRRGHEVTVYTRRWSWAAKHIEWMEGVRVVRFGCLYPVEEWAWRLRRRLTGRGKGEYLGGVSIDQVRMKQAAPPKRRIRPMAMLAWLGRLAHVLEWRGWFRRKSNRPDVLHVHADTWEGVLAAVSGARWNCPVFIKPTGFPLRVAYTRVPLAGRGQREAFAGARWIALTPDLHAAIRETGVNESRIAAVPNGVEIPPASFPTEREPMVLMVGNLTQGAYYKAFDLMLQAWSQVASAHPGVTLCVAGAGDPAPWLALAETLGCAGSVRFLGRVKDVGPLYDASRVFCLPSREEGISNALLEAQSRGVTCVVSDIPANRAVVEDGVNGRVVPVGDAEALAGAVTALLRDPVERERLGRHAALRTRAEFEIGAVVSRLEAAYRDASARSPDFDG